MIDDLVRLMKACRDVSGEWDTAHSGVRSALWV